MSNEVVQKILLMVLIPFIFVAVLIPFIRQIAIQIGAIDKPRTRHVHTKDTPKLGGLAIFLGFLLGYMIFGEHSVTMNAILIASFIILITGIIDDITELNPLAKFIGQLAAACVIVFYGNLLIYDISAFHIYIEFNILSYPLTLFFILGCINCINLIDGLDGLSGGICAIYYLTIGIIAVMQGKMGLDCVLTFVMLGSTLGFLVHNFNPASIFAGDSGTMFMGLIISIIALLGFKNVTMTSLIIPLLILAIPILDTLFAILRRTIKGEKVTTGDKFHIHHQLLNITLNTKSTVLIIYILDLLFAFASIVYVLKDPILGYVIYGILLLIVILFVVKTDVVFEHGKLVEKLKKIAKKQKRKKLSK